MEGSFTFPVAKNLVKLNPGKKKKESQKFYSGEENWHEKFNCSEAPGIMLIPPSHPQQKFLFFLGSTISNPFTVTFAEHRRILSSLWE